MSITIYYGLKTVKNLYDIKQDMQSLLKKANEIAINNVLDDIQNDFLKRIINMDEVEEVSIDEVFEACLPYEKYDGNRKDNLKFKNFQNEFVPNIALMQPKDKNYFILCPFGQTTYQDLLAMSGYEEYGYWDSSNQPDNITDNAWNERLKDWETALLDGNGIPSKEMFTLDAGKLDASDRVAIAWRKNQ